MIEPLLGTTIPDEVAGISKYHRAGDTTQTVIMLQQAFDNVRSQENIALVCTLCAKQGGVRLIAVEGADSELRPGGYKQSVQQFIAQGSRVSAGVMSLLQDGSNLVDIWGVDDMTMNQRSQKAMMNVNAGAVIRDRVLTTVRPMLAMAQSRCYGNPVSTLRAGSLSIMGERAKYQTQIELIKQACVNLGVKFNNFPLVHLTNEIYVRERRINYWRVRYQQVKFILRVRKRMFNWFKLVRPHELNIDFEKAKPVLEFWMEKTGQTPEELDRNNERRGIESVLLECKTWLDNWLMTQGSQSDNHSATASKYAFHEELMRFALRLEVPFFDLHDFREYVAINRYRDGLTRGLMDELAIAGRILVDRLGKPEAQALGEIEDHLDSLYRALCLEVPPGEADAAEIGVGILPGLLAKLALLAGQPFPTNLSGEIEYLDKLLADAALFLQLSKQRSRHMALRTLELMKERGEDRAILVAGGFHERAIVRDFEDQRGLSWSVLFPSIDLGEIKKKPA